MDNMDVSQSAEVDNRCRTIVISDSCYLPGDGGKRFIPGDSFKLAFASLSNPFHGILETIRGIQPLPISTTPETGPELRLFAIICLNPGYDSILNIYLEQAGAATVGIACRVDNLFRVIRFLFRITHFSPDFLLSGGYFGLKMTDGLVSDE
jgi:hypothetical protein